MKNLTKFTFLRKLLAIFVSIALIVSAVKAYEITHPSTAFAIGDLTVNWGVPEGSPIFVVNNMAPGDDETSSVIVANNASTLRPVAIRGIKTSETGNISAALDIVISEGVNDLYTNTLAQFFIDSAGPDGIPLFDLTPSQSKTIVFKVTFNSSSGNEYQAQSVVFDIKIGISFTLPQECSQINFSGEPIFGTQNRDVLNGTEGNDIIVALEGSDIVNAKGGDDCVIGGAGDDRIHGQNGNDVMLGEAGRDTIDGDNGNDFINGGADDDKINGNNGDDIILGGLGNDDISAENGSDSINGEGGNDDMRGGNNNDSIIGGPGTDKANGENGTDTCSAEAKKNCEL